MCVSLQALSIGRIAQQALAFTFRIVNMPDATKFHNDAKQMGSAGVAMVLGFFHLLRSASAAGCSTRLDVRMLLLLLLLSCCSADAAAPQVLLLKPSISLRKRKTAFYRVYRKLGPSTVASRYSEMKKLQL
jgi:hypothetical protein